VQRQQKRQAKQGAASQHRVGSCIEGAKLET